MTIKPRSGGPKKAQKNYASSITAILTQVQKTRTGKIVMRMLNSAPYDIFIEPNNTSGGSNNAEERAASWVHQGNADLKKAARGSRSIVMFSPKRITKKQIGMALDEVLLHELCHSLRTVYGRTRHNGSGGLLKMSGGFDSVEEFFCAMVTNVHSSENGRKPRGDHGAWALKSVDQLRKPPFSTRMKEFKISMPGLYKELSKIPTAVSPFNPFRDL